MLNAGAGVASLLSGGAACAAGAGFGLEVATGRVVDAPARIGDFGAGIRDFMGVEGGFKPDFEDDGWGMRDMVVGERAVMATHTQSPGKQCHAPCMALAGLHGDNVDKLPIFKIYEVPLLPAILS